MKILVVTSDYPPTPGGIAKLSYSSALALHRAGHQVMVLASGASPEASEFDRQQPFPTVRVPARLGLREVAMWLALWRTGQRFRPDVIWSALWFPCGWLATLCPFGFPVARVISTYGSEVIPNRKAGFKQLLKAQLEPLRRRVFAKSDWIFALSRYTREQILRLGAPEQKIEILPGGVDAHWFEIQPHSKVEGRPVVLTVARLDEHKGHDVVIQSLPGLLERFPGLRYVIVGPPAGNWERLEALATSLGVRGSIEYWGKVEEHRLYQAYAAADLFVMPSREVPGKHVEGFGLTYLEAAAVGVPSVGGNSGGVPDAVEDGYSGLLVDPTSPQQVGDAIARFLEDREFTQRLGEQARRRAQEQFSWDSVARQMLARFEQLVAGRKV